MNCPICRQPVVPGDPDAPFCSERCQLIDLGRWADGSYVISAPLEPDEAAILKVQGADEE